LALQRLRLAEVLRLEGRWQLSRLEVLLVDFLEHLGVRVDHLEAGVHLGSGLDEILADVGYRSSGGRSTKLVTDSSGRGRLATGCCGPHPNRQERRLSAVRSHCSPERI
jgi:hypothetical protein